MGLIKNYFDFISRELGRNLNFPWFCQNKEILAEGYENKEIQKIVEYLTPRKKGSLSGT